MRKYLIQIKGTEKYLRFHDEKGTEWVVLARLAARMQAGEAAAKAKSLIASGVNVMFKGDNSV